MYFIVFAGDPGDLRPFACVQPAGCGPRSVPGEPAHGVSDVHVQPLCTGRPRGVLLTPVRPLVTEGCMCGPPEGSQGRVSM